MGLKITRISLLALIAIACCATIRASSQRSEEQRVRLPRRLSSRHNELASTESAKKTSQLLSGGHLRAEITTAPTTSTTESSLEDGLLLSSAGAGKERKNPSSPATSTSSDDDDKKTLSQQVKEGKYGLIQDEIYAKKPKRPGVISYSRNPEVPTDTADNFGGLDEEEIWLAENHVLVLKGGNFPEADGAAEAGDRWPPIDDYKAPRRQVKIPPRPRVPPPFPVQLLDGGPIQLIGTNGSSLAENGTIDFEALPGGFKGFLPGEGPYFPFPSSPPANASRGPEKKHKAEGAPGPFYPALPPGAVIVPPPSNQTDYDDEDQSIYYPPPYSFVYPRDNSTDIPPGPLVPGIILPPPPDFFSPLDEPRATTKDKPVKRPSTTPAPPSTRASSYLPPRKSSTKLYKTHSVTSSPLGRKTVAYSPKPFSRAKLKNATFSRYHTEKTTPRTFATTPFVEVTTPAPAKTTTLESPIQQFHIEQLLADERIESSTERSPWRAVVSSEPVPLLTFYASSSPSSVDQPVETTPSAITNVLTTENPARYPGQASYYFYEEASSDEQAPSSTPQPVVSFLDAAPQDAKKDYYDVEVVPSQQTAKDYNVKLIDSLPTEPPPPPSFYRYIDSGATSSQDKYEAQPIRNQSPRMLHSEPLYQPRPPPTRPPPPRLSYFESPRPKSFESLEVPSRQSNKPKPIYQYSFEANNYSKRAGKSLTRAPEIPQPPPRRPPPLHRTTELPPLYPEYQDVQTLSGQYDYETSDVGAELVADHKIPAYISSKKKERTYYQPQPTTASPIRDTTLAGHQQYFTKQDEQLLDDVTKEYFTVFGKKLPSTTPIYGKSSVTERPDYQSSPRQQQHAEFQQRPPPPPPQPSGFRAQNIKVHYGDHTPGPFSLKDDVLVNYKRPLPPINPDSEFVSVVNGQVQPVARSEYRSRPSVLQQLDGRLREFAPLPARQRFEQRIEQAPLRHRPVSLAGDVAVNYRNPRPPLNPDAEFVEPAVSAGRADADKPNAYFAYRLPGDGGHFYFLTPQAIGRQESTGSYLYSRPRGSGLLRRRRARDGD